jgi:hypothetical protein
VTEEYFKIPFPDLNRVRKENYEELLSGSQVLWMMFEPVTFPIRDRNGSQYMAAIGFWYR